MNTNIYKFEDIFVDQPLAVLAHGKVDDPHTSNYGMALIEQFVGGHYFRDKAKLFEMWWGHGDKNQYVLTYVSKDGKRFKIVDSDTHDCNELICVDVIVNAEDRWFFEETYNSLHDFVCNALVKDWSEPFFDDGECGWRTPNFNTCRLRIGDAEYIPLSQFLDVMDGIDSEFKSNIDFTDVDIEKLQKQCHVYDLIFGDNEEERKTFLNTVKDLTNYFMFFRDEDNFDEEGDDKDIDQIVSGTFKVDKVVRDE